MQIVIRNATSSGAWYKKMIGQVVEVEDEPVYLFGAERYKVKGVKGSTKFVRVSDSAPIRPGLVAFIEHHEASLKSDAELLGLAKSCGRRSIPVVTVDKLVKEKREMLEIIRIMAPVFESVYHNTIEGENKPCQ